jgi:O-Antigen ligase
MSQVMYLNKDKIVKLLILALSFYVFCFNFTQTRLYKFLHLNLNILLLILFLFFLVKAVLKGSIAKSTIYFFIFIHLIVFNFFFIEWNEYSTKKITLLILVLIVCFLVPLHLITRVKHAYIFSKSLAILGFILGLYSIVLFLTTQSNIRFTIEGANPIYVGRAVGFTVLFTAILFLQKRIPIYIFFPVSIINILVLISTGSKGPLVSIMITFILIYFIFYKKDFSKLVFILLGCVAIGIVVNNIIPIQALDRIFVIFGNSTDSTSLSSRIELYKVALSLIPYNPMGIGVGGFSLISVHPYPHNLILEIFLELGWLFGVYFLLILSISIIINIKLAKVNRYMVINLGLLLYSLFNSFFSGDITSAKELYVAMAVSISLGNNLRNELKF